MKFVYTDGCIVSSLTVDGKDLKDFTKEEKLQMLIQLDSKLEEAALEYSIISAIQELGDYKHLYHCDECGDEVVSYTLKI